MFMSFQMCVSVCLISMFVFPDVVSRFPSQAMLNACVRKKAADSAKPKKKRKKGKATEVAPAKKKNVGRLRRLAVKHIKRFPYISNHKNVKYIFKKLGRQVDISIEKPTSVNGRLMPAEHYILDGLGLYICGVTESMTPHHKSVAQRISLLANYGEITRKSDAVDGRETRGLFVGEFVRGRV